MTLVASHRLVERGERGLACDDIGVAIGPVELILAEQTADGHRSFRCVSREIVADVAEAIFGSLGTKRGEWLYQRLMAITEAMTEGKHTFARIAAVHLGLSEIPARADSHLEKIASNLRKFNPRWFDEARDGHGRWTGQGNGNPIVPVIEPYSPECLEIIADAKRRCIKEYGMRGGNLGRPWMMRCIQGYVPIGCGY